VSGISQWLRSVLTPSEVTGLGDQPASTLDADSQARLTAVLGLRQAALGTTLQKTRWVVADVETSGLNPRRDRLLAIGAVAVVDGAVALNDSFEVILKQDAASTHDNILIHRISTSQQLGGEDAAMALLAFLEYVGNSPLVGYHAHFDEMVIARAIALTFGMKFDRTWLDLAMLAPAVDKRGELSREEIISGRHAKPLDWWLDHCQIKIGKRHHAAADALATAQLWCSLMSTIANGRRLKLLTAKDVFREEERYRWSMEALRR
jgi:DNA polymerase III subunit epsilon